MNNKLWDTFDYELPKNIDDIINSLDITGLDSKSISDQPNWFKEWATDMISQPQIWKFIVDELDTTDVYLHHVFCRIRHVAPGQLVPCHLDFPMTDDGKQVNIWMPLNPSEKPVGFFISDVTYEPFIDGKFVGIQPWSEEEEKVLIEHSHKFIESKGLLFNGMIVPHGAWAYENSNPRYSIDMRVNKSPDLLISNETPTNRSTVDINDGTLTIVEYQQYNNRVGRYFK